jgi:hypothetical protein
MNSKSLTLCVVLGLAIVLMLSIAGQGTSKAAGETGVKQWEHLAMTVEAENGFGGADTSRKIVQLGSDGWELVDVETVAKDGTTTKVVYFFKRPK